VDDGGTAVAAVVGRGIAAVAIDDRSIATAIFTTTKRRVAVAIGNGSAVVFRVGIAEIAVRGCPAAVVGVRLGTIATGDRDRAGIGKAGCRANLGDDRAILRDADIGGSRD